MSEVAGHPCCPCCLGAGCTESDQHDIPCALHEPGKYGLDEWGLAHIRAVIPGEV